MRAEGLHGVRRRASPPRTTAPGAAPDTRADLVERRFAAEAPERALRLNLRAQLQLLRANGVPVARTWAGDLVEGAHVGKLGSGEDGKGWGEGEWPFLI